VPDSPLEAMKSQIAFRHAVVIVGSGVSVAVTGNSPTASWLGLIKSGISRASSFNRNLPEEWKERLLEELDYAEKNDYLPGLLSIAEKITAALGGREGGSFHSWLRDDIGLLSATSADASDLIRAIGDLGLPLATTNYDTLLESSLVRSSCTWQDASTAQQIVRGASSGILHLHGSWENPGSVIFGSASYGQLLANRSAQAIEQMLAGDNTLIFIGCGDGLADPNFESLRSWLKETFPSSEAYHYRLCLEREISGLAQQHRGEQIITVAYGNSYDDLTPFIRGLVPAAVVTSPVMLCASETVQQRAVEAIYARAKVETVIADHLANADVRTLDGILIPPVFLPMTAEQFAQSMNLEKEERPQRCNPSQDVDDHESILVISAMTAGLTSSLEWLVTQANRADNALTPIIVDFRSLGQGLRPLERQVRKELRLAGVDLGPNDPLPKLAIAIDNASSRPDKIFSRAIDELKNDAIYTFCVIGCHEGAEAEIMDRLIESGKNPAVRYVGKLNKSDAIKIAALIEPARADRLAAKAMWIAKNECLPRTPMTIGLLVCMLLRGEFLLSTASPTALLDAWVNLLLGRGDPHDDARFSLDSLEKADILAFLAERFVLARTGSLSEGDAIACLDEYFAAVGWREDPIEVLGNFKSRYLLSVSNGQVRFSQSSYLHLFAAKRAKDSNVFRTYLYEDLLYFDPIIRHYAALTRNDEELLTRVEQLLSPSDQTMLHHSVGRSFTTVPAEETSETSIEDLLGQLSLSPRESGDGQGNEKDMEQESSEGSPQELTEDTWLDQVNDSDREPFPVENIDGAPPVLRIMTALTLASIVLRDSELVKNLKLKKRILHRALLIWGKLVNLLDSDEDFSRFWTQVGNGVAEILNLPEARRSKFVDDFANRAPTLLGFQGVSATLSSRKLLSSLDACFSDTEFLGDAPGSVMGAFMGYDIHVSGWTKYFTRVQKEHGRIMAVSDTMTMFAEHAYYEEPLATEDAGSLLAFLVVHYSQRLGHRSAADRKLHEGRIAQRLKKNRVLARASQQKLSSKPARIEIDALSDE
jgi:SIR2-like domain